MIHKSIEVQDDHPVLDYLNSMHITLCNKQKRHTPSMQISEEKLSLGSALSAHKHENDVRIAKFIQISKTEDGM